MITLSRADGSSVTYEETELAAISTGLEASNNQHSVANGIAFIRTGTGRLLILDVDALHNRKLLETYAIHYDGTFLYNLKFTSSNVEFPLDAALDGVGFSNLTPISSLASIFAAQYAVAANQQYLKASNLVKTQGTLGTAPAEIKTLVGGTQISLVETSDDVTISMDPLTINYPLPNYGEAPGPTSTYAETTIHSSTNVLAFCPPLSWNTQSFPNVDLLAIPYSNVNVSYVSLDMSNIYTKTEVDNLSTDLSNYYTQSQVVALIAAAKQEVLDSITFSDNFTVDRSVAGTLAISGGGNPTPSVPTYDWPTGTVYYFDGSQTSAAWTGSTTVTGSKMPIVIQPNLPFSISFEFNFGSQTNSNRYVFALGARGISLNNYGNTTWSCYTNSAQEIAWSASYTGDVWTSLSLTYDGSVVSLSINGTSKGSLTLTAADNSKFQEGLYLGSYAGGAGMVAQMRNFSYTGSNPAP